MPPEPSNYRKILGKNIKKSRRRLGWTQEQFAARCDLFRSYLSRIEGGTANPTLTVLVRIATELQQDVWALFLEHCLADSNDPFVGNTT